MPARPKKHDQRVNTRMRINRPRTTKPRTLLSVGLPGKQTLVAKGNYHSAGGAFVAGNYKHFLNLI